MVLGHATWPHFSSQVVQEQITPQGECKLSLSFSKRTWLYFLEESSQGKALIIVQFGSLCRPSYLNKEIRLKQVGKGEGVLEPNVFLGELANEPKNSLRNHDLPHATKNMGKPHFSMKTWAHLPSVVMFPPKNLSPFAFSNHVFHGLKPICSNQPCFPWTYAHLP